MSRILFLNADPTDTARLRLQEELRDIKERLRQANLRETFQLETEGKEALENLVLAVPWSAEESSSKNFAQQACRRWGGGVNWRTAASYDATQAFIKALSESGNPSRQTVFEKLKSITLSPNETSGHGLKFKDGERDQEPVLVKVVKGSGSGNPCGGFQEGGFHFEKVPEKEK